MIETNDNADTELDLVKEELKKKQSEAEEYLNKYKYLLADYDNYRKGIERESQVIVNREIAKFLTKMIGLREDYVRAIETAKNVDSPALVNGLKSILQNLDNILKDEGVKQIDAMGKDFDPNLHEAISFVANDEYPENTVIAEIRKGYMLSDRVIRPTLVEVSKKTIEKSEEG